MTVATWTQPDYTTMSAAAYKAAIDGAHAVAKRFADNFAPHEQAVPNMTVRVDAGFLWDGATLTEVAAQSTGTITAPVGNPRIDRVVMATLSGVVSVVTGTPAVSPVAPAIPAGSVPIASVLLQTSSTSITNSMITDERVVASSNLPTVMTVTGNTTLVAGDMGKTVYVTAKADITLPAASAVPVGAPVEIVSDTTARQRIYPAGADLIDGLNDYYRLPSHETITLRKVAAGKWKIVNRPQHGVGAEVEWAGTAGTVAQVWGPGWVDANAGPLNRVTYENLFDVLGTSWGAGDGSTTFGIPDDRGRVAVGSGTGSGLTARTVGQSGGAEVHALTGDENGPHTHTAADAGHAHGDTEPSNPTGTNDGGGGTMRDAAEGATGVGYASIVVYSSGLGQAHNNMQPFNVKRKLIKV